MFNGKSMYADAIADQERKAEEARVTPSNPASGAELLRHRKRLKQRLLRKQRGSVR